MTRHIDFEGIENFRDLGGYDTACGRGMKAGVVYRSANHGQATDADLAKMAQLGIATIVDLRRRRERDREPARRWPGFNGQVIENDIEGVEIDWVEGLMAAERIDVAWFQADSMGFYHVAPHQPRHVDLFRRYFRALAESDGALVVHCAAGKDRTGLICALTHHIAGVHRDDTLTDYLLTNNEARMPARIDFLRTFILDLTGKLVDDEALRQAASVHPDYLDHGLAAISESHGGIDRYLEEVLEVDSALRGKIEARILR
ncbi:tyrosine-protein phosphatase [Phenylobacterium sp.]|uniref:tyrosine-protein phosphatase n=1 Tax=Phenylobacterium sp. TaxID=1871053 RepID=UPI0030F3B7A4